MTNPTTHFPLKLTDFVQQHQAQVFTNHLLILKILDLEHISNHLNFKVILSQLMQREHFMVLRLIMNLQLSLSQYLLEFQQEKLLQMLIVVLDKILLVLLCIILIKMPIKLLPLKTILQQARQLGRCSNQ